MLGVLPQQEMIGHPGDVVTDNFVPGDALRGLLVRGWHRTTLPFVIAKEFLETPDAAVRIFGDRWMVVDMREEEFFQLCILRAGFVAEARESAGRSANVVHGTH